MGHSARLAFRNYGHRDARHGEGSGPGDIAVVLLHGLFGSSVQWHHVAMPLSQGRRVLVVDLANHGASPHRDSMDYPGMADEVRGLIAEQGVGRAHVIGHSMGGKVAMALALLHAECCASLAVLDIAPVRYEDRFTLLLQAVMGIDVSRLESRAEVDEALRESVDAPAMRAMLLQNLQRREGRLAWRIHWRGIADSLPQLLDFCVPGLHGAESEQGGVPTLLVRGEHSDYVAGQGLLRMQELFPLLEVSELPQAGHWLHVDQPAALVQCLQDWLGGHAHRL